MKSTYPVDRTMTYVVVTYKNSTFIICNLYLLDYPRNNPNFKEIKEIANYGKEELINWLYAIHDLRIKYPMANVIIGGTFNESDISNYIYEKFIKISRIKTVKSWGYEIFTIEDENGPTEIINNQNTDWICIRSFIGSKLNVQIIGSTWHKDICDDYKLLSNHRFLEITISY